jgi:GNAT superfamily N-acetyltransferase
MNAWALQHYLREMALSRGYAEKVGPFLAAYDPHTENPFRNFAIPDDDALPSEADLQRLVACYASRDRTARVEYFPTAAPLVEEALVTFGFEIDRRPSVLACRSGEQIAAAPPEGIEIAPVSEHRDVDDYIVTICEAFGEGPPTKEDFTRLANMLRRGGGAVIARDQRGRAVGTAQYPAPQSGVTEIAGVGVLHETRRRGIGAALTTSVLELAFSSDVEVAWLSPEDHDVERIYERCGFTWVCEALHLHLPQGV